MSDAASLTREESAARAELLRVHRYDIEVDLTGLLAGETFRATSTVSFACARPGGDSFVDVVADVESASLNGVVLDPASLVDGRLPLTGLAEENLLVVTSAQSHTDRGEGVLRTVDPSDGLVYVWTSFEPDEARRLWACFDQPDLKAPHRFVVTAPESWTVTSNSGPSAVGHPVDGARRWEFDPTPALSTYVVVVNAGPFHEVRSRRGDHDLGLLCRQSLARYLDRDAEELFDLTDRGLAWFGERFGQPFPQERYDQVFVPNMGGAMENWGCVTWTDAVLFRSPPTHQQRSVRANILLHEMAHMWFGDLVTMRWWDDLWLNEAFASWAATWAQVGATQFTESWASTVLETKLRGYQQDMGPASHPIRGDVPNVLQAMANFDDITYCKGEGVLKQLAAYVGEDAFVQGLRAYFRDHAWGNTTLDDLMAAFSAASGRDLAGWTTAWLDRSGTDSLVLDGGILVASAPDGGEPRPHRLRIASYELTGDGLTPAGTVDVEVTGRETPVDLPAGTVQQVNADDLTFASVRADAESLAALQQRAGALPDALSRALAVATAWDMLVRGDLTADDVVTTITGALSAETGPAVVEPMLALGLRAAEEWAPYDAVAGLTGRLATTATGLAGRPQHRQAALRILAATASTEEQFALLDSADDLDIRWRTAGRRAELGRYDAAAVAALEAADPDPDAPTRALAVRGSRPDAEAKEEVWQAVMVDRRVPVGMPLRQVAQRFWRPLQADLLAPYAVRYLDVVQHFGGAGMLAQMSTMRMMLPLPVIDQAFLDAAEAIATAPDANPTVRTTLLNGLDTGRRALRARTRG